MMDNLLIMALAGATVFASSVAIWANQSRLAWKKACYLDETYWRRAKKIWHEDIEAARSVANKLDKECDRLAKENTALTQQIATLRASNETLARAHIDATSRLPLRGSDGRYFSQARSCR